MTPEDRPLKVWHRRHLRPPRLLRLRLTDPDRGRPFAPPSIENIVAAALFASAALAAGVLGAQFTGQLGFQLIFVVLGAVAWLLLLAWGVWRVRPQDGCERAFRLLLFPILLQALCAAVGAYYAVMATLGRWEPGFMGEILVTGGVLTTFAGIAASFLLQGTGRRVEELILAQFTGPFLMIAGVGGMAAFG
jgi:hypothetical protein